MLPLVPGIGDGLQVHGERQERGDLRALLVCVTCSGELDFSQAGGARCRRCGAFYEMDEDVLVLLEPDGMSAHKRRQAAAFDHYSNPLTETTRPRGLSKFYGYLQTEKFDRGMDVINGRISAATAAVICGGSGMDAEFLARSGARVITFDISHGATLRARQRARDTGLEILSVVADCERLPLRDRSVDLAYVHDGLHHLADPLVGVREMARVAGGAVSINEPTPALATMVAIRAGISEEVEDTGNRVQRLDPDAAHAELQRAGFPTISTKRYAMFYRHEPGPAMRFVSRRRVAPLARWALLAVNRVVGRAGNKLNLQGVRTVE
jgi:SAM-dependent methyltransferase